MNAEDKNTFEQRRSQIENREIPDRSKIASVYAREARKQEEEMLKNKSKNDGMGK